MGTYIHHIRKINYLRNTTKKENYPVENIRMLNKEIESILNKHQDNPEFTQDFKRVVSLFADVISETLALAMIEHKRKTK